MRPARLATLTAVTMGAFAANSVLCRLALSTTEIDPATFTLVRLASGAGALAAIAAIGQGPRMRRAGNWRAAIALFAYAAAFSFAYVRLTTGTGALLLFGAVQLTMIGYGIARGERLAPLGVAGAAIAAAGLVVLVAPGIAAPAPAAAALMLLAGAAWGAYSIRGRGSQHPVTDTAGNFLRALPLGVALAAVCWAGAGVDVAGAGYAVLSGALASGVGYAVWYAVLPHMPASSAAVVQLSVPVIAAAAGVLVLGEALTTRLVVASVVTLGGVWMALGGRAVTTRTETGSRRA